MTTRIQLDEINAAISAILSGAQSYKIGSRSITKANLDTLIKERQRLEYKLAAEQGFGISVANFDRR